MTLPAISVQALSRSFSGRPAVDKVSFAVEPGEIFGLVGPDGAGKTTTLRMLCGLLRPDQGEALVMGLDPQQEPKRVKDALAYMSQRFGLYVDLTVQENIEFYADLYGVRRRERGTRIDELLDFSYMRPFKRRLAGKLSGGMKQKLQLVCALVHTPQVLLLDEPTNGVDPVSRRDFWRILYRLLAQGVAILVTTAYLDEAERCNRVGLLDHGRLLALGTPEEVKAQHPGNILSLRSTQARTAAGVLRSGMPGARVDLFGDQVHFVTNDAPRTERQARELLALADVPFDALHTQAPTLEDVFVAMLGEHPATDDAARMPTGQDPLAVAQAIGSSASPSLSVRDEAEALHPGPQVQVQVQDLTRRFGSFVAVNAVSFEVERGEIFGFLGPNGAGKSTVIRMLCGLLAPSDGRGTVAGFDIARDPERIKRNIGYMSQKFSLYEDLTVEENIGFYGGIYGLRGARLEQRKRWALEMADLQAAMDKPAALLSGGWKQRLALACAVLHEPPIVFLDEPTSGVDPLSRRRFWDLIHDMSSRGVTVFVTTHYMEEAEYCDRVALIFRGSMIALGSPMELKTQRMREKILDVQCPAPQRFLDQVSALPEVREAALFGSGMHLVVDDESAARAAVEAFFARQGQDVRVAATVPGMEDVFVSLIEEVERSEAAAGAEVRA